MSTSQLSDDISMSTNRWWNKNQDTPRTNMKTKKSRRPSTTEDPHERLREQIARVAAENFELRESNVKLQRLSKLQDAKKRELMHKVSLQKQQRERAKADKRLVEQLRGTVDDKRLQIGALEAQIELAKVRLAEEESAALKAKKLSESMVARVSRSEEIYTKSSTTSRSIEYHKTTANNMSEENYNNLSRMSKSSESCKNTNRMRMTLESRKDCSGVTMSAVPCKDRTRLSISADYCKPSRGAKRGSKSPSLKNDDDMNHLSRLNGLLEELNDNNVHVAGCDDCKRDLKSAQSRIEGLLAKGKGVAVMNDTQKKGAPSTIYGKSDTVEIFDTGVQVAMGDCSAK